MNIIIDPDISDPIVSISKGIDRALSEALYSISVNIIVGHEILEWDRKMRYEYTVVKAVERKKIHGMI